MNHQIIRPSLQDVEDIDHLYMEAALTMRYPREILECIVAGKTMEGWKNIIQNEDFFVLKDEETICGFVHFGPNELFGLFVRKDKMRCGYGRALFEFAVQQIPARPFKILSTLNAEGFYSRMGCIAHEMTFVKRRDRDVYVINMSYGSNEC